MNAIPQISETLDGWVLWSADRERAQEIAEDIRAQGFQACVFDGHVYVLATEGDNIPTS